MTVALDYKYLIYKWLEDESCSQSCDGTGLCSSGGGHTEGKDEAQHTERGTHCSTRTTHPNHMLLGLVATVHAEEVRHACGPLLSWEVQNHDVIPFQNSLCATQILFQVESMEYVQCSISRTNV